MFWGIPTEVNQKVVNVTTQCGGTAEELRLLRGKFHMRKHSSVVRTFPQSSVDMSDTREKTQLLPPQGFTTATTGASILRKWLNRSMHAQRTPTAVLYTFLSLNFIRDDIFDFTLTAQCSSKPPQVTAHMGQLRRAFFFFCAEQLHAVTLCNHRKHRHGLCMLAGGCHSIHHWFPRAPCVWNLFTSAQQHYWLSAVSFQEKSINVSSITVTGVKRIHVAAVTELCPGPSYDLGQTK